MADPVTLGVTAGLGGLNLLQSKKQSKRARELQEKILAMAMQSQLQRTESEFPEFGRNLRSLTQKLRDASFTMQFPSQVVEAKRAAILRQSQLGQQEIQSGITKEFAKRGQGTSPAAGAQIARAITKQRADLGPILAALDEELALRNRAARRQGLADQLQALEIERGAAAPVSSDKAFEILGQQAQAHSDSAFSLQQKGQDAFIKVLEGFNKKKSKPVGGSAKEIKFETV